LRNPPALAAAGQTNAPSPSGLVPGGRQVPPAVLPLPGGALPDSVAAHDHSTLVAPSQRSDTLAADQGGKDRPTGPTASWAQVTTRAHRRILDQVFAELDGGNLW
jgi:hypothetical protein